MAECRQIQLTLTESPYFSIEMMSPQLISKFVHMIKDYNYKIVKLKLVSGIKTNTTVCEWPCFALC
jgi:hypothetical protein